MHFDPCFLGPEFFPMFWKKVVLNLGIKGAECSFVQILIGFKDFFGYVIPWKSPISELSQKNISGTGNSKYGKWRQNLHFQKHQILYLWFYWDLMFLVFWFLHFLCKFGIPRELCASCKSSEKVEKSDISEKKIPIWRSTDRQAPFLGWSHCWSMEEGTKLYLAIFWKI